MSGKADERRGAMGLAAAGRAAESARRLSAEGDFFLRHARRRQTAQGAKLDTGQWMDGRYPILKPTDVQVGPDPITRQKVAKRQRRKQNLRGSSLSPESSIRGGSPPPAAGLPALVAPGVRNTGTITLVKILRGAKPADIPVEQPDCFELVINLKPPKRSGMKSLRASCCAPTGYRISTDFAALRSVAIGTSRRFAVTHRLGRWDSGHEWPRRLGQKCRD
jgi:hypothetical protein